MEVYNLLRVSKCSREETWNASQEAVKMEVMFTAVHATPTFSVEQNEKETKCWPWRCQGQQLEEGKEDQLVLSGRRLQPQ